MASPSGCLFWWPTETNFRFTNEHESKTYQSGKGKSLNFIDVGKKPFKCEKCGITFPKSKILKSHLKSVHDGYRTFKCDNLESFFKK